MPSEIVNVSPSNRIMPKPTHGHHQPQTPKHQKHKNPERHRDRSQQRPNNPPSPPKRLPDPPSDPRPHAIDNGQHYHHYHQQHHNQPITNGLLKTNDNISVYTSSNNKVSAKEADTASDKQNQNTWFITNERQDSLGNIPVIPLFTHTANSVDFHKNGITSPYHGQNNDLPNNFIHYSNGYPPSYPPEFTARRNNFVGGGGTEQQDILNMGRIQELKSRIGADQVRINEGTLWKLLASEFLGTALLMVLGCGCVLKLEEEATKALSFVGIALCWGLTVATLAQALGGVSCDINPAVTVAKLCTGKTSIVKAIMYILIQCLGALAGVAILKAITPETIQGDWGATKVATGLTPLQGCFIEIVSTFILVFTVFSVSDENRTDIKGSAPLAIGLSVAAIVMVAGPLTGASLNPARSLGPSIIGGNFDDHWVYWIGPIVGGVIAGLIYEHVFRQLRPDEVEALEAEMQLRQREREAKENGVTPTV